MDIPSKKFQPLIGARWRQKMKTCNGCEHLIKLFSKSIDKKYLYVCVGEAKYGIAKAILETDKEGKIRVPTPYWCPKEAKNVQ